MKYIVSDIHGNMDAWNSIKSQINLGADDELYILGDVIDRNPHGIEILQEIMHTPNMHMILGNHEYMMLSALGMCYRDDDPELAYSIKDRKKQWYSNGGKITHKAYEKLSKAEQEELVEFLRGLPLKYVFDLGDTKFILAHANLEDIWNSCFPDKPEMAAYFAVWDRDSIGVTVSVLEKDYPNAKLIIGHTPTEFFDPDANELEHDENLCVYKFRCMIDIDCGAAYDVGRLACLRADDMKIFYSK